MRSTSKVFLFLPANIYLNKSHQDNGISPLVLHFSIQARASICLESINWNLHQKVQRRNKWLLLRDESKSYMHASKWVSISIPIPIRLSACSFVCLFVQCNNWWLISRVLNRGDLTSKLGGWKETKRDLISGLQIWNSIFPSQRNSRINSILNFREFLSAEIRLFFKLFQIEKN